jgi:hypothetical protein
MPDDDYWILHATSAATPATIIMYTADESDILLLSTNLKITYTHEWMLAQMWEVQG